MLGRTERIGDGVGVGVELDWIGDGFVWFGVVWCGVAWAAMKS